MCADPDLEESLILSFMYQDLTFSFKLIWTKVRLIRCEITGRNMYGNERKEIRNMKLMWDRYENTVLLKLR